MDDIKQKDLPAHQRQAGQTKTSIGQIIAQKRLSDIIFDADACSVNPEYYRVRQFIRVGDFIPY